MKRRMLNLLTVLSLVLCVAACALWVRSRGHVDQVRRGDGRRMWLIVNRPGGVYLSFHVYHTPQPPRPWGWQSVPATPSDMAFVRRLPSRAGFRWGTFQSSEPSETPAQLRARINRGNFDPGLYPDVVATSRFVFVPHWFPAAAFAVAPVLALASAGRRRRRRQTGRCTHCGYDLTGNVSGVCPECGRSR